MTMHNKIEQIAYGQAASIFLSDFGQRGGYQAYTYLLERVRRGKEPVFITIREPFCDESWKHIVELIENEAGSLLGAFESVLELAGTSTDKVTKSAKR